MRIHANARTCPKSRKLLVRRIEEEGWSLMVAAEAAGISERTAAKWLARWRAEGDLGLEDRSSAPKRVPARLPAERVAAIEALRRLRMTAAEIAEVLGMALSTVSRWLARIGLGRRSRLAPPEPPNRYERKRPGELIHVDVKKLGRIQGGAGKRVRGGRHSPYNRQETDRAGVRRNTVGWEFVHVCVDDATRLAYVEVLPDEKGATAASFLGRAVAWFKGMGITVERVLSDNGSCYRSRVHAEAAGSSRCATSLPAPTDPGPTARPSASSRPSPTAGPTERSTAPLESEPRRWPAGSTTTTTDVHTAPSAIGRPQLGSPSWNNVVSNYS
jgi:transposase